MGCPLRGHAWSHLLIRELAMDVWAISRRMIWYTRRHDGMTGGP